MANLTARFFRDERDEWRWHVKTKNNRIIGCSGEGYKKLRGARHGFDRLGIPSVRIIIEREPGK